MDAQYLRDEAKRREPSGPVVATGEVSPPSPSSEQTPAVRWGEPELHLLSWSIIAECGCGISLIAQENGGTFVGGDHCHAHTFADLVSGEHKLRQSMNSTEGQK